MPREERKERRRVLFEFEKDKTEDLPEASLVRVFEEEDEEEEICSMIPIFSFSAFSSSDDEEIKLIVSTMKILLFVHQSIQIKF